MGVGAGGAGSRQRPEAGREENGGDGERVGGAKKEGAEKKPRQQILRRDVGQLLNCGIVTHHYPLPRLPPGEEAITTYISRAKNTSSWHAMTTRQNWTPGGTWGCAWAAARRRVETVRDRTWG